MSRDTTALLLVPEYGLGSLSLMQFDRRRGGVRPASVTLGRLVIEVLRALGAGRPVPLAPRMLLATVVPEPRGTELVA